MFPVNVKYIVEFILSILKTPLMCHINILFCYLRIHSMFIVLCMDVIYIQGVYFLPLTKYIYIYKFFVHNWVGSPELFYQKIIIYGVFPTFHITHLQSLSYVKILLKWNPFEIIEKIYLLFAESSEAYFAKSYISRLFVSRKLLTFRSVFLTQIFTKNHVIYLVDKEIRNI